MIKLTKKISTHKKALEIDALMNQMANRVEILRR